MDALARAMTVTDPMLLRGYHAFIREVIPSCFAFEFPQLQTVV